MRDLTTNNAKTTLSAGIASNATSCSVAVGTGTLFPNPTTTNPGNLIIAIDNEVILCSGVSGDTISFTTRGYDGTTAAAHNSGATVQLVITAGMLNHLWQNTSDRYTLDAPPSHRSITPSTYDDEFEKAASWTLYPNDAGITVSYGGTYNSFLSLNRNSSTSTYYLYKAFAPTGAYTATCCMQNAGRFTSNTQAWLWFFISDQTNPTGGLVAGNRVLLGQGIDYTYKQQIAYNSGGTYNWPMRSIQQVNSVSGVATWGTSIIMQDIGYRYLQLKYDGAGNWTQNISLDGITYNVMGSFTQAISPATIGWAFTYTGSPISHTAAIDWIRVTQP